MAFTKWIGGFIGVLSGGFIGGLAGYAIGSVIDELISGRPELADDAQSNRRHTTTDGSASQQQEGERNGFLFSLMLLAAHIIQADGRIMHSEMEYVRTFLRNNYGEGAMQQGNDILLRLFERRKQLGDREWERQILISCQQLSAVMPLEQRLQLLAFLCEIAKADRNVATAEVNELHRLASHLLIDEAEVNKLLNLGGNTLEEAYRVLGVSPDATDDEVRRAYRKMALQYHPDKVATLGDDVKAAAEKKFKEIGAAKDLIWQARGL